MPEQRLLCAGDHRAVSWISFTATQVLESPLTLQMKDKTMHANSTIQKKKLCSLLSYCLWSEVQDYQVWGPYMYQIECVLFKREYHHLTDLLQNDFGGSAPAYEDYLTREQ